MAGNAPDCGAAPHYPLRVGDFFSRQSLNAPSRLTFTLSLHV